MQNWQRSEFAVIFKQLWPEAGFSSIKVLIVQVVTDGLLQCEHF